MYASRYVECRPNGPAPRDLRGPESVQPAAGLWRCQGRVRPGRSAVLSKIHDASGSQPFAVVGGGDRLRHRAVAVVRAVSDDLGYAVPDVADPARSGRDGQCLEKRYVRRSGDADPAVPAYRLSRARLGATSAGRNQKMSSERS